MITAHEHLPGMPPEVFEIWIKPHIERSGSPPCLREPPLAGSHWDMYLRGKSLEHWSSVRWQLRKVKLESAPFEQRAVIIANDLAGRWREYEEAGIWRPTVVADSRERLESCINYLRIHKALPAPLVCSVDESNWLVLDGQHRLGAIQLLPESAEVELDIWLGEAAL